MDDDPKQVHSDEKKRRRLSLHKQRKVDPDKVKKTKGSGKLKADL